MLRHNMTVRSRPWKMRIAVLVLAVAVVGCKKREASSPGTGSGSGSGSAMGEGSNSAKPHRAGNCPSTVARSTTSAAMAGSAVQVTISSDDPEAIAAVQKRADELLAGRMEHHADTGTEHKQNGEHGGGMGMCPVYVPEGATATASRVANGVVVSITAQDPAALKTEIDGRIQRAADWEKANIPPGDKGTQGALGGGKNDEGMNHSGKGDGKGVERKHGDGQGGGLGSGGGSGNGTGGGSGGGGSGGGGSSSGSGSGSSATP
jgi:hypothetical protein